MRNINILIFNVRSIIGTIRSIIGIRLSNAITMHRPSVIALTETWLTTDMQNSELQLLGYVIHRSDRVSALTHSAHCGALLALHHSIPHTQLDLSCLQSKEIVGVVCDFPGSIILIICCYNPPTIIPYRWTIQSWRQMLFNVKAIPHTCLYLMGDVNLPGID